jgi:ABC-type antimicrobial peptide transport system permease subunit
VGKFRLLPWEYGVRNLFRRPSRTGLTLLGLTLVVLLVLVVVGFIRGLENSLAISGDPRVILVHAPGGSENVENSTVAGRTGPVLAASVEAVQRRYGQPYVSPEIYLGTRVTTAGSDVPSMGLVRGVTPSAHLVRRQVQVVEGHWPSQGELMAGRLAAAKIGCRDADLAVGQTVTLEGRHWTISGRFAAVGSALESELWCPLADLQTAMKRQDYSLVAITLAPGTTFEDVDEFFKERLDLEIQATPEIAYYANLQKHYGPVRTMAWLVVGLVAAAGVFAGMNAMYGSVLGRVKELATLQTMGFTRRAITLSLIQEAVLLAAAAALAASGLSLVLLDGTAVRFTMGAFTLRIDGPALLIGCGTGVLLGVIGALPPAWQAMRLPIVDALKAV